MKVLVGVGLAAMVVMTLISKAMLMVGVAGLVAAAK
jgi:hypothetical protein